MKHTALTYMLIGMGTAAAAETLPVTVNAVFMFNDEEIVISRARRINPQQLRYRRARIPV